MREIITLLRKKNILSLIYKMVATPRKKNPAYLNMKKKKHFEKNAKNCTFKKGVASFVYIFKC